MKKLVATAVMGVAVVTAGFGLASARSTVSANSAADITGVWEVTAVAPYAPHLFTFNSVLLFKATCAALNCDPDQIQLLRH